MNVDAKKRQADAAELGRDLRRFLSGVDMIEIARTLGDRVRAMREAQAEMDPPSRESIMRALAPSAGDLGTHTFAARDEARRWSNSPPPPSDPPDYAPSTRKLESEGRIPFPSLPPSRARTPSGRPRGRKDDPAMMIPTPMMVQPAGELPNVEEIAGILAADDESKHDADLASIPLRSTRELETIATRPLATPVQPRRLHESFSTRRTRRWALASVAAVAALAAVLAWRAKVLQATTATPAPTQAVPLTTATTPIATATASQAPVPTNTTLAPSTPTPPTNREPSVTLDRPAASAEKSGRATVSLVGDPGTRVSIDGALRGTCPTTVTLEPGQHEVRFMFDATGESRGERIGVKGGDRITVRASFTGASPTIRIQRVGP
jgi:hypothetical protein